MSRGRFRPEYAVACPKCEAAVDERCHNGRGGVTPNFHADRTALVGAATNNACEQPRVACWLGCAQVKRRCEFCGMCSDPDCKKRH